jgi:hypothetical protein
MPRSQPFPFHPPHGIALFYSDSITHKTTNPLAASKIQQCKRNDLRLMQIYSKRPDIRKHKKHNWKQF